MELDLHVLSTHLRPARAGGGYVLPESTRRAGDRMRLARFGCRWGCGTSFSSRQAHRAVPDASGEPTCIRCLSAGSAPRGQGRCATA